MKNLVILALFGLGIYFLWKTVLFPSKWIGFYYPDANDLTNSKQSPELKSLEECREWVDDVSNGRTDTGFDYECGKRCKPSKTGGIYVCDETVR